MDLPLQPRRRVGYAVVPMAGQLLLPVDLLCLVAAAAISTVLYASWSARLHLPPGAYQEAERVAVIAMLLAPFILFERHFGAIASRGRVAALQRAMGMRFTMFSSVVLALAAVSHALDTAPRTWLLLWLGTGLALTSFIRAVATVCLRGLQRSGALAEVIAVVGAGPVADRLVLALRLARPESIDLLGVFDDEAGGHPAGTGLPTGTLSQLIELGKTRSIDWIVLTTPPSQVRELASTVSRLKALSAPIALCPQDIEQAMRLAAGQDGAGNGAGAGAPWHHQLMAGDASLPRWVVTPALIALQAMRALASRLRGSRNGAPGEPTPIGCDNAQTRAAGVL